CVRGGRGDALKELKNQLQFLLSRGHITTSFQEYRKSSKEDSSWLKRKEIEGVRNRLKSFTRQFEQADLDEISTGEYILRTDETDGLWNRILRYFLSMKIERRNVFLWDITELYLHYTDEL